MDKKIFKKVMIPGGILSPKDMTAEEKRRLYALMEDRGASGAFTYTRFFRDGFAQWEIDGIWKVKIEYLQLLLTDEKLNIDVRNTETKLQSDGETYKWKHFCFLDGREISFDITFPGDFWRFLGDIRHRINFGEYMAKLGMKSQTTVAKRFSADDWKEYEQTGIRQIIEVFE